MVYGYTDMAGPIKDAFIRILNEKEIKNYLQFFHWEKKEQGRAVRKGKQGT